MVFLFVVYLFVKHKHMEAKHMDFRDQVTLTSQPRSTLRWLNFMLWLAHAFDMRSWFQSFSKLPDGDLGEMTRKFKCQEMTNKQSFSICFSLLVCRASTWDDLLVLHAKPLVLDKRTSINALPCHIICEPFIYIFIIGQTLRHMTMYFWRMSFRLQKLSNITKQE